MTKYKVLNEAGIAPVNAEGKVTDLVAPFGEIFELGENEQTTRFLEGGFIEVAPEDAVLTDLTPAKQEKEINKAEESSVDDIAEANGGATEPRARYRGHLVIAETDRVVGEQTFKHITLDDGSQMDLDEKQYRTEVHISYPPAN